MGHGIKFGIAAAGTLALLTVLSWSREPTAPGVASASPGTVVSGGTAEAVAESVTEELVAAAPSSAELESAAAPESPQSPSAEAGFGEEGETEIGCKLTEPEARAAAEAGRPNPASIPRPRAQWIKHSVKEAETLISIARRYLKDGAKWKEILDANPRLRGPEYLRTGMTLLIPNTKGAPAATSPGGARAVQAAPKPATPAPALSIAPKAKTYKVVSGDTLSKIALKTLGAKKRWREVFEANQDRLASPDALRVGQELRIPRG